MESSGVVAVQSDVSHEDPAPPIRLNYDILIHVMSFLPEQSDIGRTMRSCRTLNTPGVPHLLRDGVQISHPLKFLSFYEFMFRDAPFRFRYLRKLDIKLPRMQKNDPVAKLIAITLEKASRLSSLKFSHPLYMLRDERICSAIISLTSLDTLMLPEMTKEAMQMLHKLQSPLKRIKSSFPSGGQGVGDPVSLFQQQKNTLEALYISWADFRSADALYPRLTTLRVEWCRDITAKSLYGAFPNLRNLFIHWAWEEVFIRPSAEEMRTENVAMQEEAGSWAELDHMKSSILTAYILGLQCRVHHLDLCCSELDMNHHEFLTTALHDTQPSVLNLYLCIPSFTWHLLGEVLLPAINTLAELHVGVAVNPGATPSIMRILKEMLSTLRAYSLRLLHISVQWKYVMSSPIEDRNEGSAIRRERVPQPQAFQCTENPLDYIEAYALAYHVFSIIPSLQQVCMTTQGVEDRCYCWERRRDVEGDDVSTAEPVELAEAEGKRVLNESTLHRHFPSFE